MHKTISITLDGQLFHVEEPAYQSLDLYLNAVRQHFASYPDRVEIVSDIESRMAEQFNAKTHGTNRVINQADVDEVIKTMGTVEDFKEFIEEPSGNGRSDAQAPKTKRKLYRDPDNKILGGVASGLAAYFGDIDPTIVRLIFILTLFAGGTGVIVYLILWLIVPEASTPSEKMAMHGEPVTIASLEKKFRETMQRADEQVKKNEALKKGIRAPFDALTRLIEGMLQVLGKLVLALAKVAGFFIAAAALAGILAATFALVALFVNINSPYVDFPWRDVMDRTVFYVLASSAFLALVVPLKFIFLAGASLLSGKSKFKTPAVAGLVAIWFAALLTGGAVALRYGPEYAEKWDERKAVLLAPETKSFDLTDFERIEVTSGHALTLRQGDTFEVKASGDTESLERLELTVEDGTLMTRQQGRSWRLCLFCVRRGLQIEVTMPTVSELSVVNGSRAAVTGFTQETMNVHVENGSRMEMESAIASLTASAENGSSFIFSGDTTQMNIRLENGSRAEVTGTHQSVTADVSNASRLSLSGSAESLNADVANGSRLEAMELKAQNVITVVDGYSRAEVQAHAALEATILEASRLEYLDTGVVPQLELSDSSRAEKKPTAVK